MKKVYIIHRWSGGSGCDWYPWLKAELLKMGYEAHVPEMPNTDKPVISERVDFLKDYIGTPDENTFFVGHSIGSQTVLRYLETFPEGTKVGGLVFVAPWFKVENLEDDETRELASPWIETPIDLAKIKRMTSKIKAYFSTNEPYGFVDENKKIFENDLGAEVEILSEMGHFTEEDGIRELPQILEDF